MVQAGAGAESGVATSGEFILPRPGQVRPAAPAPQHERAACWDSGRWREASGVPRHPHELTASLRDCPKGGQFQKTDATRIERSGTGRLLGCHHQVPVPQPSSPGSTRHQGSAWAPPLPCVIPPGSITTREVTQVFPHPRHRLQLLSGLVQRPRRLGALWEPDCSPTAPRRPGARTWHLTRSQASLESPPPRKPRRLLCRACSPLGKR